MKETFSIPYNIINKYMPCCPDSIKDNLMKRLKSFQRKIIVLDDDPTGVQTVYNIPVYTSWDEESIKKGFLEKNSMFFILTNSRSFTVSQTIHIHDDIAKRIVKISKELNYDYIIVSRSDSTLRGHYPIETETLRTSIQENSSKHFDGEIICPFFLEGERYTINNIHYVRVNDNLVPVGLTEYAKDKSFGFSTSNLMEWCEQKTNKEYVCKNIISISCEDLQSGDVKKVTDILLKANSFNKIIVNAITYDHIRILVLAYLNAIEKGREFIFRTAASVVKILANESDRPLLKKKDLVTINNFNAGLIIIGSHVKKTTLQLDELRKSSYPLEFIEFNQHLVLKEGGLRDEVERVSSLCNQKLSEGKTVVVFTKRERVDIPLGSDMQQLQISVQISEYLTSIVQRLKYVPSFIIAKGGITSSDIGTKALHVKRAIVKGQIAKGVPVWITGAESKFPNLPYIIFPGNVGNENTLREIVEELM